MRNFDLNALGVSEMSESQTRDANGGVLDPITPILIIGALFAFGYQMGADRAAADAAQGK